MKRDALPVHASVAELFRVTTARTRRRLVRLQDAVDWALLTDIVDAVRPEPDAQWPQEPLTALIQAALARKHGRRQAGTITGELLAALGEWPLLLQQEAVSPEVRQRLGLAEPQVGSLRLLVRSVMQRFGGPDLAALANCSDERALKELTSLPGVDVASACTLLVRNFGRPLLPPTQEVRRVLTRMGVLPPDLTAQEAQAALARIPPSVATENLFVGLTALAEETCKEEVPGCQGCPVCKLCARGRRILQREAPPEALTFIDLFAGAGGMSLGLVQAGLVPLLAVDKDAWACETYRLNHPEVPREQVITADITRLPPEQVERLLAGRRPDLVVGGPPCQGFSLIGKRGRSETRFIEDERNRLYKEFVRWVIHFRPRFVVIENVPGLYSYAGGACRSDIEANLQEAGYAVADLLVDAARFGVPQRRQRVLFVGVSVTELGEQAEGISRRIAELLSRRSDPEATLRDAIADLPPLEAGEGQEATRTAGGQPPSTYASRLGAGQRPVRFHHVARPINLRDLLLYARLQPGEKGTDAVRQEARHLMVYRDDVFHDKYRRLKYDEPCPTIMSHLAKDGHMFIHPDPAQRRSLTVREAARVQSFPDDFIFCGPRTYQFTQVGNAVPPLLARGIGEAIIQALAEVKV